MSASEGWAVAAVDVAAVGRCGAGDDEVPVVKEVDGEDKSLPSFTARTERYATG